MLKRGSNALSSVKFGLLGHKIAYSLSPLIHNTVFKLLGVDASYEIVDIPEEVFDSEIRKVLATYRGLNVTIPYKTRILTYLTDQDDVARTVGAVNTILITEDKVIGYNTDVRGIIEAFKLRNVDLSGRTVLILGAGGAARAAVYAAHIMGASAIYVCNRTLERALELKRHFENYGINVRVEDWDRRAELARVCDVVINCTPVGTQSWDSPLPENVFRKGQAVLDMVYRPRLTKLLNDAYRCGAIIVDGLIVLIFQALAADEIWLGRPVLSVDMFRHVENVLVEHVPDCKLPEDLRT